MEETIKRINELYHKSKSSGLSEAEKEEQGKLRRVYIDSVKGNLKQQLDNTSIEYPDGRIEKVSERKKS